MWVLVDTNRLGEEDFWLILHVDRWDAATLLPIIQQWVAPGSTVWTDMWGVYNQLQNMGFQHKTMNHSLHFVAPNTGMTTNRLEAMWSRAKDKFKAGRGPRNREMVADYMAEFTWNQ